MRLERLAQHLAVLGGLSGCPQLLDWCEAPKDLRVCSITDATRRAVHATGTVPAGRDVTISVNRGGIIQGQTADTKSGLTKEASFDLEVSVPPDTSLDQVWIHVDGMGEDCLEKDTCGCFEENFYFSEEAKGFTAGSPEDPAPLPSCGE